MKSKEFPVIGFDLVYEATQHFSNENQLGKGGCSLQPDDDERKVRLPYSYCHAPRSTPRA